MCFSAALREVRLLHCCLQLSLQGLLVGDRRCFFGERLKTMVTVVVTVKGMAVVVSWCW